jgi:hypothetical protein
MAMARHEKVEAPADRRDEGVGAKKLVVCVVPAYQPYSLKGRRRQLEGLLNIAEALPVSRRKLHHDPP